ncbi:MAG: hypothetical protein RIT03_645 [Bacteroidota bacterium]|jgi:uncharacterized protein YdhG (YjbR/CyaY superfamily)
MKNPLVTAYIEKFPEQTQAHMHLLRALFFEMIPEVQEVISYQMPAYKKGKIIGYFAGYKNHIGFYPTATGIKAFEGELSPYNWSKGAIQFPLDQPLPLELIRKIIQFKCAEK